jgi:threonine dehydrogenase-like Zn-dependent dehydrogenase
VLRCFTSPLGYPAIVATRARARGIFEPTDALVRVVLACVCASDLWYYR